jgi:hypothetical protein
MKKMPTELLLGLKQSDLALYVAEHTTWKFLILAERFGTN